MQRPRVKLISRLGQLGLGAATQEQQLLKIGAQIIERGSKPANLPSRTTPADLNRAGAHYPDTYNRRLRVRRQRQLTDEQEQPR